MLMTKKGYLHSISDFYGRANEPKFSEQVSFLMEEVLSDGELPQFIECIGRDFQTDMCQYQKELSQIQSTFGKMPFEEPRNEEERLQFRAAKEQLNTFIQSMENYIQTLSSSVKD